MGSPPERIWDAIVRPEGSPTDALHDLDLTNATDLRRVGEALIKLADAFAPLDSHLREGQSDRPDPELDDVELAAMAEAFYLLRRQRARHFPADLFAEPAWDILLTLFIGAVRGERVSTKSLCLSAEVPSSTALRWLGILEARNLIRRWTPPDDQRLTLVRMTSDCYASMRKCLSNWLRTSRRDPLKLRMA